MRAADRIHLGVVFSHGTTLKQWKRGGLLDREVAHLNRLRVRLGDLTTLTYDRPGPALSALERRIAPIGVRPNRTGLDYRLHGLLAPVLRPDEYSDLDVLRTTQISGSWTAAIAKKRTGTPFVLRCGYLRSLFYRQGGAPGWRSGFSRWLEKVVAGAADHVFAATASDLRFLIDNSGAAPERFTLLPNPIDSVRFSPVEIDRPWCGSLLFVGRLHEQKNLLPLVDVVNAEPAWTLRIVGDGPLAASLRERANTDRITFAGFVDNADLPDLYRQCDAFILPSVYEGNPKTLLEAMACGCAVIGADSPGIANLIDHGNNGLLCKGDSSSLALAVHAYGSDVDLRRRCRAGARRMIVEEYDGEVIAEREARIIREIVESRRRRGNG